jgi:hypothetical protein
MADSDSIEIENPEKIIAQPQPSITATSVPVISQSPTPSPSATKNVSVAQDGATSTTSNVLQICREVREMIATNSGVQEKNTKSCWPRSVKSKMGPCVLEDREYFAAGQLVKNGVGIESINVSYSHAGKDKSIKCETLPLPYTPGGPNVTGYRATEFLPNYFEQAKNIDSVNWTISGGINMTVIDTFEIKEVKSTSPSKNVSTTPNVVGNNIDLNKTKICLTIFQHGTSDNYCYKDLPVIKEPQIRDTRGIDPNPGDKFLTLYVPWSKSNIFGCTKLSYTVQGQAYANGELFFNDWTTGTINRNSNDTQPNRFCQKFGGFDYAVDASNPYWIVPYFNVAAYDKSKPLPQNYEVIKDYGEYKINYIYTWQKR